MDPYVAGVLVGIGSAAVVIAVMAAVRKKQGQPKAEYDERQLAARGIAYRWAYMTLIFSLLANTGVEAIWGPWAKPGVAVWMMIFLSVGVFVVVCVRRDAYFAMAQDPKASLWLFGAVVVLQIPNIIITLRRRLCGGRPVDLGHPVSGQRSAVSGADGLRHRPAAAAAGG